MTAVFSNYCLSVDLLASANCWSVLSTDLIDMTYGGTLLLTITINTINKQNPLPDFRAVHVSVSWQAISILCCFSGRTLHLPTGHSVKTISKWFADHGITELDWLALNSMENKWGFVKRKMRDIRANTTDDMKVLLNQPWLPEHLSSATGRWLPCHTMASTSIDAAIHAKEAPVKYWVHKWT